ncbi:MAG: aminotransferase class I/II-fold pyridoxal phosphate-dependent enzyme [Campylobacteraceae bacterium]|nr:aminotransferase class I/II-fold pyridoxal phosphate-dependent enzyme [Campylobacteraceae bacterium]
MYTALSDDKKNIDNLIKEFYNFAVNYLEDTNNRNIGIKQPKFEKTSLPEEGKGFLSALKLFKQKFEPYMSGSSSSRYFGFVTGGATPTSLLGDWITSLYDQNVANLGESCSSDITLDTINQLKQLFELDDSFDGIFVSGATMSNFVGLATARQWFGKYFDIDVAVEGICKAPKELSVFSATPHSSIYKSLSMLGLGKNSLKLIPTSKDSEAINIDALEKALKNQEGIPCIIVANAGTVNTVAFDDIKAISELKKKYNFWLHVDAAFGGFAKCSPKYKHLVDGFEKADSLTIDAHKWLNVPYDSAMHFTKHLGLQFEVFQNSVPYLKQNLSNDNFVHLTPENSQRLRALPAWFGLNAYGVKGYCEIVERNCALALELSLKIKNSQNFILLSDVVLNGICFTLNIKDLNMNQINQYIQKIKEDGKIFITPTIYQKIPAIRISITNWQTEKNDIDIAWKALKEALGIF